MLKTIQVQFTDSNDYRLSSKLYNYLTLDAAEVGDCAVVLVNGAIKITLIAGVSNRRQKEATKFALAVFNLKRNEEVVAKLVKRDALEAQIVALARTKKERQQLADMIGDDVEGKAMFAELETLDMELI